MEGAIIRLDPVGKTPTNKAKDPGILAEVFKFLWILSEAYAFL